MSLNVFIKASERSGVTSVSVSQASGDFGSGDGDRTQTGNTVKVVVSITFFSFLQTAAEIRVTSGFIPKSFW